MALANTLDTLARGIGQAHEMAHYLWLAAAQDYPRPEQQQRSRLSRPGAAATAPPAYLVPVLVEKVGDGAASMMGDLNEAMDAVRAARGGAEPRTDLDAVRVALARCQTSLNRAAERFHHDLGSYQRLTQLARFAQERKGEWQPWAHSVRHGINSCRAPLDTVNTTMQQCWQELAERAGAGGVSVVAVGQQFGTTPALGPALAGSAE